MSLTYETTYSKVALGLIKGRPGFLSQLSDAFDIPGGASAGVINVDMLDAVTVETPSAGTFLAQGLLNTLTAMTLTNKFATNLMSVNTRDNALQSPAGQARIMKKFADALYMAGQAAVIAGLKAASITTNAKTLAATFIDFAIPSSSTTTAAMILEYMQPVYKLLYAVLASHAGSPLDEFWVLAPTAVMGNLAGLGFVQGVKPPVTLFPDGTARIDPGIKLWAIDGTSFGGRSTTAGLECMFIGHKDGYGFKFDGMRPWRGGVPVEDGDGQYRQSVWCAYAYGIQDEPALAEVVNPKS